MTTRSLLARLRERLPWFESNEAERAQQQLARYRELHENAQYAQRQFEFVVLADLVIFGQFVYESPYLRTSVIVIALCFVFGYWHTLILGVISTAYREMFIRAESDGTGPTIIEYIEGDPIELLYDLVYRSNSLAYVLLFFPTLYLAIVSYFQGSPTYPAVIPALGSARTAYVYTAVIITMFTSIAYYLYRPSARLSLTIDPETDFLGDRAILFFRRNENRIDRYAEVVSEALLETMISLLGLLILLAGIATFVDGNVAGLAAISLGLLLFWPARRLFLTLSSVYLDPYDAMSGVAVAGIALAGLSLLLNVIPIHPLIEQLLRVVTTVATAVFGVFLSRWLRTNYTIL